MNELNNEIFICFIHNYILMYVFIYLHIYVCIYEFIYILYIYNNHVFYVNMYLFSQFFFRLKVLTPHHFLSFYLEGHHVIYGANPSLCWPVCFTHTIHVLPSVTPTDISFTSFSYYLCCNCGLFTEDK